MAWHYTTSIWEVRILQSKRISISINEQVKGQLEQLAKINYRTLNGEINKALEVYISLQLGELATSKEIISTPPTINETSIHTQTEVVEPQGSPIYTNNNQYDEVEDF